MTLHSPLPDTEPPHDCQICPRLAAFRELCRAEHPDWWNAPVPAFGDPNGKIAIVGHTSLKDGEVLDLGHLVCIDTYCWGGGWLTALEANNGQIWQADRDGQLRSDVRPLQPTKPA